MFKNRQSRVLPDELVSFMLDMLQGIPLGLAMGSMPFLLKKKSLSYADMATFSLTSYPYSLKVTFLMETGS
jgi:PAT family acetyl-CoA transporter-like MFS transporter 1